MPDRARIDLVLLTGAEAAIASRLEESPPERSMAALSRLRGGSTGFEVESLQGKLGITVDGYFGLASKIALAGRRRSVSDPKRADGVYSLTVDNEWGWGVFPR